MNANKMREFYRKKLPKANRKENKKVEKTLKNIEKAIKKAARNGKDYCIMYVNIFEDQQIKSKVVDIIKSNGFGIEFDYSWPRNMSKDKFVVSWE